MSEREDMMKACELASKLMIWFSERDPPVGPKEASEAMIVGLALILKSSITDKKALKEGVKLTGMMIRDVMNFLEYVPMPEKGEH